MGNMKLCSLMLCLLALLLVSTAEQCGTQAGGALCPNNLCCSQFGYCGDTDPYCGQGCQSQCKPSGGGTLPSAATGGGVGSIVSRALFDQLLKHRNDAACEGRGFYTYDAFIEAARAANGFGTTGDDATKKRELAAFLAQTSHETTGGWATAPDGPYAWGYCFIRERNQAVYCTPSGQWPCAPGKKYFGRGPIQLTHNYNYGPCGRAINQDLLNNPDLVATNAVVSFRSALWFWMTPQGNKPSSHDVITGRWTPNNNDKAAGRVPGFGVITNIINGGLECGKGPNDKAKDRVGFYQRYCQIMGVSPGNNLDCNNQRPFG